MRPLHLGRAGRPAAFHADRTASRIRLHRRRENGVLTTLVSGRAGVKRLAIAIPPGVELPKLAQGSRAPAYPPLAAGLSGGTFGKVLRSLYGRVGWPRSHGG